MDGPCLALRNTEGSKPTYGIYQSQPLTASSLDSIAPGLSRGSLPIDGPSLALRKTEGVQTHSQIAHSKAHCPYIAHSHGLRSLGRHSPWSIRKGLMANGWTLSGPQKSEGSKHTYGPLTILNTFDHSRAQSSAQRLVFHSR